MEPYAPYPLNLLRDGLHRWRWRVRLVLAVVLVPYGLYWTYARCTIMPPLDEEQWDADVALRVPPAEVDRTADVVAAMKVLVAPLTVTVPTNPPEGQRWVQADSTPAAWRGYDWAGKPPVPPPPAAGTTVDSLFYEARWGAWTPDRRLLLGEIVRRLQTPETAAAMARLEELNGEPYCITSRSGFGRYPYWEPRIVARMFAARMRYHTAERGDFRQAARDARTAIQLSDGFADTGDLSWAFTSMSCRYPVLEELMIQAREFDLTRDQVRGMIDWLESHAFDTRQAWHCAMQGERAYVPQCIDVRYTQPRWGTGWLVLHQPGASDPDHWLLYTANLMSPLFEDRASVERLFEAFNDHAVEAVEGSRSDARRALAHLDDLDGKPTLPAGLFWSPFTAFRSFLIAEARQGAAAVALALSAYHTEKGAYPPTLDALVPDYLSAVVIDPFSEAPLCYRLDDRDGYVLYSVGEDGQDDGGIMRNPRGDILSYGELEDIVFPSPKLNADGFRDEPVEEWILVNLADYEDEPEP